MPAAHPSSIDFSPTKDEALLRQWIKRVCKAEGISLQALVSQLQDYKPQQGVMSLSTLTRFMGETQQHLHSSTRKQMIGIWSFLSSKPEYVRHFGEIAPNSERFLSAMFSSADELLSYALTKFFEPDGDLVHTQNLASMKKMLPGRYVMYRLDLQPAQRNMTPRKTVRVSLIEITASESVIHIKEIQDFPAREDRAAHQQTNIGIVVPYATFMIALFRTPGKISFKCMVIDDYDPRFNKLPLDEFSGKLLVASELAFFPSVKFVCRRTKGNDKHGIYKHEEIDQDILKALTTPTFPKKYNVIS